MRCGRTLQFHFEGYTGGIPGPGIPEPDCSIPLWRPCQWLSALARIRRRIDCCCPCRGLASFLGQQTGLELVFLNGCATQNQAQGLLDANVSTVIATSQAIDDRVAAEFASRFYRSLAGGASIQGPTMRPSMPSRQSMVRTPEICMWKGTLPRSA